MSFTSPTPEAPPLPAFSFSKMRSPLLITAILLPITGLTSARDADAPATSLREAALENLLAGRGSKDAFDKAVAEARKHGVAEQSILEAGFLHHVDCGDEAAIAALVPECLAMRDKFRIEDSAVFAVREDWLAVVEYVQAVAALRKGDRDAFKKHITEAFWLSPGQGAAFAPHIERLRLDEAMRAVAFDFDVAMKPVDGGGEVTPASLMKGRKALLLHFWSPWSRECEASMRDFATCAESLVSKGIAVVSLIPGDAPDMLEEARALLRPLGDKPCGAWLIDAKEKPLGRELRVRELPVMVLVSPDGKVLFNGNPGDERLWKSLREINPDIIRPDSPRASGE